MPAYFLYTSSLVKRFAGETGSRWVIELFRRRSRHQIFCSSITYVEMAAALSRKLRVKELTSQGYKRAVKRFDRQFSFRIYNVEVSESLIQDAARLAGKHFLRAYDALQLASAIQLARQRDQSGVAPLTFVNSDTQLSRAALTEGLIVEDPNDHR